MVNVAVAILLIASEVPEHNMTMPLLLLLLRIMTTTIAAQHAATHSLSISDSNRFFTSDVRHANFNWRRSRITGSTEGGGWGVGRKGFRVQGIRGVRET